MSQIIDHNLFEEENQIPTQMGFIPFPTNLTFPFLDCNQSLKAFSSIASSLTSESDSTSNLTQTLLTTNPQKSKEYLTSSFGGSTPFLSLHRSIVHPW